MSTRSWQEAKTQGADGRLDGMLLRKDKSRGFDPQLSLETQRQRNISVSGSSLADGAALECSVFVKAIRQMAFSRNVDMFKRIGVAGWKRKGFLGDSLYFNFF